MKLNAKLIVAMLIAGIVPLAVSLGIATHQAEDAIRQQAFNQLDSLRSTKRLQIESYFRTIRDQVLTMAQSTMIVEAMQNFSREFHYLGDTVVPGEPAADNMKRVNAAYYADHFGQKFKQETGASTDVSVLQTADPATTILQYHYIGNNPHALGSKHELDHAADGSVYSEHHARYHPIIRNFLEKFSYYDIFLVDADTGHIVYSVFKELDFATSLTSGPYRETGIGQAFKAALKLQPGDHALVDFQPYLPSYNAPASFISTPIYANNILAGVLIFQMPVGRINAIMQQHEGMGNTGETYLVGEDGGMRSQSRFSDVNTILAQQVNTDGVAAALNGETGRAVFSDYRDHQVVASYSPLDIAGLNWVMLAEIDEAEAFAAVASLRKAGFVVAVVAALLVLSYAFLLARSLSRRLNQAVSVAKNIAQGNFDNSIDIGTSDEVGELLGALESMQGELFGRITAEKNEALRIAEALKSANTGVLVVDAAAAIVFTNDRLDTYLSQHQSRLLAALSDFQPESIRGFDARRLLAALGITSDLLDFSTDQQSANVEIGEEHFFLNVSLIRNADGNVQGAVVEWTDLTDQRRAEAEVEALLNSATAGLLDKRLDTTEMKGAMQNMGQGINRLLDTIVTPVHEARRVMLAIKSGDLSQTMQGELAGDFGELQTAVNQSVEKLRELVGNIRHSAATVSGVSNEIASGNLNLSSRTEAQASSIEQTAASMEQFSGSVKHNAENSSAANELAGAAKQTAESGGEIITQAVTAMRRIETSSAQIADIISVIDEIAFQINLLALNAAVEAARAGEYGRGFAVVAAEVRNLAQRSAVAAKEIRELIGESVDQVSEGAELVEHSGESLQKIVQAVKKVSNVVQEISVATNQQSAGIGSVSQAIGKIDEGTQQNAALVEQMAAASASVAEEARNLNAMISHFKMDTAETPIPTDNQGIDKTIERRSQDRPWANGSKNVATPRPAAVATAASTALSEASVAADDGWKDF